MKHDLYRQNLLEDARRPRHFGRMANPDEVLEAANPVCGDELTIFLKFDKAKRKIEKASFDGRGCMVMFASTTRLLDYLSGKSVSWLQRLTPKKVLAVFNAPLTPSRQECALMPLKALDELKKRIKRGGRVKDK